MRKIFMSIVFIAIAFGLNGQTTIMPFGTVWKYLDNGSNQGTAWYASSFDDAAWKSGPSELGYGQGDEATVVGYGPNAKTKYITTYFRNTFSIEDASLFSNYTLKFKLDDGMVVYCNGKEVYRNNMPSGTISYNTVASSNAADDGLTVRSTTLPASAFVSGNNVIAVEVHQRSGMSSDISFNMEIVGNAAADVTPPTVSSINRQDPTTQQTSATALTYRVTFSESVSGVDAADFSASAVSGSVSGTITGVAAVAGTNNKVYDVSVTASGSGDLRLDLHASGTGIADLAGNAVNGGYTGGQVYSIQLADTTPPTVTGINRFSPTTENTSATTVVFSVTFSESVTGVDNTDFVLTTTETASGTISSPVTMVSGDTYEVTVSNISGSGTIRLDLKATGTGITDGAGNAISDGYASGQIYTIQPADVTPPTVSSINRQDPTTQQTSATALTYRVTFSESVSGVDAADFSASAVSGSVSGTITGVAAVASTNNKVYDVSVTASGSGDLRLDLHASGTGIADLAGNAIDNGYTSGETFTIELSSPTQTVGFKSITNLSHVTVSTNTGEKPQSKVWSYAGKHWAVLPNSSGTYLWRLDGTSWTNVLRLSTKTTSKADCKVVGSIAHIFLYQGRSSQLVSVEYDATNTTYKLWSKRTSTVGISLDEGVETATIDMDSHERMWLANAGTTQVYVRWSDAPYNKWSAPIAIETNITDDDICAVIALPGKIGVLWSNQNTQRFGFKTHLDGADPSAWSSDEVPASQSALNIGGGMADDHMNMSVASNGTLYCAVKTSYDKKGYTEIALLIRHANGVWDKLYDVAPVGTRPIVLLNESIGKVRVAYTNSDYGGSILYRESALSTISFSPELTLISGTALNNATSTKDNFTSEIVILSSTSSEAVGVLASDGNSTPAVVQKSNSNVPLAMEAPATTTTATTTRIFPTLVKRGLAISIQTTSNIQTDAVVADSYGRVIQTSRFTGNTQVYTSQLAAGTYYIRLNNKAGVKTYRFVVIE